MEGRKMTVVAYFAGRAVQQQPSHHEHERERERERERDDMWRGEISSSFAHLHIDNFSARENVWSLAHSVGGEARGKKARE